MKINKEFFNFFKEYKEIDVALAILDLKESEKRIILNIWGEHPICNYNQNAQNIIVKIKKLISKKSLKQALGVYSDEEITKRLNKLSLKEKDSLLKEYYIDNMVPKEELTEEEIKMNARSIQKIRNKKRIVDTSSYTYKSLLEVFENCDSELIKKVIETLSEAEINLLHKKYGENFESISLNSKLTEEEKYLITQSILPKIKRKINWINEGKMSFIKIEDLFPNIDKKLLLVRSEKLSKTDKVKFYYYFGNDFNKTALLKKSEIERLHYDNIRQIMEDKKEINKKIRSLLEILNTCMLKNESVSDFEYRIKKALATLSNEELTLLKKKYGNDLKNTYNHGQYTLEEDYFIAHHIISKLKAALKKTSEEVSLLELFNMSIEELYLFINNNLTFNEINILKRKYGEDFNEVNLLSEEENINVIKVLTKIKNIIKTNNVQNVITYNKMSLVKDIMRYKKFEDIKRLYGERLALAVLLVNYIDSIITSDELYALTGYTKENINNILIEDDSLRKLTSHRRIK